MQRGIFLAMIASFYLVMLDLFSHNVTVEGNSGVEILPAEKLVTTTLSICPLSVPVLTLPSFEYIHRMVWLPAGTTM